MESSIRFWQSMTKSGTLGLLDKLLIGKNDTGGANYADVYQLVNLLLAAGVSGVEATITAVGGVLPTPTDNKVKFLGAGNYYQPDGVTVLSLVEDFNVILWDGAAWSLQIGIPIDSNLSEYVDDQTQFFAGRTIELSDLDSSVVVNEFVYTPNVNGDIIMSSVENTRTWDAQFFGNNPLDQIITLKKGEERFWLGIGLDDATNICIVGVSQANVFGQVVNVNLATQSFAIVKASAIGAIGANSVFKAEKSGDNILLYKDNVLTVTLSISELLGLGANLNSVQWGLVPFNASGTAIIDGDVLVKELKIGDKALVNTQVEKLYDSSLFGKRIAILGDSVSTTEYGGTDTNTVWYGVLKNRYGLQTYVNAISGTPIAEKAGFSSFVTDARWQSLDTDFIPDAVIVFGGTNDFGARNVPLGADGDVVKTTFYGALKYLFESLTSEYKTSKIFFMTPLQRAGDGFPAFNATTGQYLSDYVDAIELMAKRYNITVISTFQDSGLTYQNMLAANAIYSADSLHPNVAGHKKIADYVAKALSNHF